MTEGAQVVQLHTSGLTHWFDVTAEAEVMGTLKVEPGRLVELVNRHFRVCRAWKDLGVWTTTGRQALAAWPVGTHGVVCAVLFEVAVGWRVMLEHHDDKLLPPEHRWVEVRVPDFLRHTMPLEGTP